MPKHVAVRVGLGGPMLLLGCACTFVIINHESWLTDHALWPSAIILVLGMTILPISVAFRPLDGVMSSLEAVRYYGLAMLVAMGILFAFAAMLGAATSVLGDSIPAITGSLLLLILLVSTLPVAIRAVRRRDPLAKTAKGLARSAGLAVVVVVLLGAIVWLRIQKAKSHQPKAIPIIENPKALLDQLDLGRAKVESRRARESDGSTTLHLQADAGDIERTISKLSIETMMALEKMKHDQSANGRVVCWVPIRFRSTESEKRLADGARALNETFAKTKTQTETGRLIRVSFVFGQAP